MARPSIFSKNYQTIMRRRRNIKITGIAVVTLAILTLFILFFINK